MVAFWRLTDESPPVIIYDTYLPNAAELLVSDYAGIAERSAATLCFLRPISEGNNYKHAAPGSRVSFITNATSLRLTLFWNALITRLDTFRSTGSILIDGIETLTFACPFAANVAGKSEPVFALPAGSKTVTIVWPYAAGLELHKVEVNTGSAMAIAARQGVKLAVAGDSISHGFSATRSTLTWSYKLAVLKGWQLVSIANGSEGAVAANGSALAGLGADRVTYMIGYNNFVAQTPIATFQTAVQGWIANARAALPAAKIYLVSPIYSPNSNTITLQQYRNAVQAAELAAGDAETFFINGLSIMTNNADRLVDGIHPNDIGAAELAANISPLVSV
ncbi:lysophospholipase L1-like esterase [Mesorhizobium robiniae]|uniref:Lysophospholipase L1-like esterase n=1 Tax=Mesorhizobium robiniae TaxID=559315 RepID=A0ABV2GH94_9HYPH